MKRIVSVIGLMITVSASVLAVDKPAEKPWFDLANCDFCKHLLADSLLLPNIIWEHHDISNGLMTVSIVKPEFKGSYRKAMAEMEKVGEEMKQGKPVKMCGSCEYYGMMMMSGVKTEHVSGEWGDIMLYTSDKPEVLAMIREYGRRNREELAKMEGAQTK